MSEVRRIPGGALRRAALCLLLAAGGAVLPAANADAQEVVRAPDKLETAALYGAVTCGAAPGKACTRAAIRWSAAKARDLRIGVSATDATLSKSEVRAARSALSSAIEQINGAGAGVHLTLIEGGKADITVEIADYGARRLSQGTSSLDDRANAMLNGALTSMTLADKTTVRSAEITLFDRESGTTQKSIVLNILLKTLGLNGAVEGRYYQHRSIFSNGSNRVIRLKGQDLAILRMHYPPAS